MHTSKTIGIEAMTVHVPRFYLAAETLAGANGTDPAKYKAGLGVYGMAIPHPNEDPVTMAVDAASALMQRYGIDAGSIGLLIVGSETGVDAAKPIAAYVHGLLHLPSQCRTLDAKHACYSATAALKLARDWCAGSGRGRKALVVASDIARYDVGSPGEPTQGAGAVAMIVGDDPALLALDEYPEAFYTRHVMDFWRPHYRSAALVDGPASIESYLKALACTYEAYEKGSGLGWDDYESLLFHVPFPKMAFKGYRVLYEREAARKNGSGMDLPIDASFERRTAPALWANRELGNLYSGSLYLSLAGLLERGDAAVEGARVGLFSYGSGCCGEFFSGRIGGAAAAWRDRIGISAGLRDRVELDHQEYLAFRDLAADLSREGSCGTAGLCGGHTGRIAFCGVKDHKREYVERGAASHHGVPVFGETAEGPGARSRTAPAAAR